VVRKIGKIWTQYYEKSLRAPYSSKVGIIHVRESLERLDERDSTESFLDIDDVV